MSVNITISVPLEAVAAVTQGCDPSTMADALAVITKAAVAGVKALPYDIKPALAAADEEDNLSIKSFDSDEPAARAPPTKRARMIETAVAPTMKIVIRTSGNKEYTLKVAPTDTVAQIKQHIEHVQGFSTKQQRLIFDCARIYDKQTLASLDIQDGDTLELHTEQLGS